MFRVNPHAVFIRARMMTFDFIRYSYPSKTCGEKMRTHAESASVEDAIASQRLYGGPQPACFGFLYM